MLRFITFRHAWLCGQVYGYMEQCAPHAAHVRAKFFHVDDGAESWLDYQRIVRILDGAGFNEVMADLALLYRLDGAPAPLPPPAFDAPAQRPHARACERASRVLRAP